MQKLYVVVRGDLSPSQRAVQAGHAVAEWCITESGRYDWNGCDVVRLPMRWTNGTLVYLKVPSLTYLMELSEKIGNCCPFYEEYYNREMTAFAYLGEHELLEYLPLL